jgi:hypothetical protein
MHEWNYKTRCAGCMNEIIKQDVQDAWMKL